MKRTQKVIKCVLRYEIAVSLKNSDFWYQYGSISYPFGYEKNRCFFLMTVSTGSCCTRRMLQVRTADCSYHLDHVWGSWSPSLSFFYCTACHCSEEACLCQGLHRRGQLTCPGTLDQASCALLEPSGWGWCSPSFGPHPGISPALACPIWPVCHRSSAEGVSGSQFLDSS